MIQAPKDKVPSLVSGRGTGAHGNDNLQSLGLKQRPQTLAMHSALRAVDLSRDYRIRRVDNLT
ncbi:MAG: hypothetical protein ACLQKH_08745 [Steroidobacteraceae bacterium]